AVLPPDAVVMRAGTAEATAPAVPGDGVLAAGADAAPGQILRCAGERLRAVDVAVLRAVGVPRVAVRAPRFVVIVPNVFIDAIDGAGAPLVGRDIEAAGGLAAIVPGATDGRSTLDDALQQSAHADAIVIIGGSGAGRHDASVRTLEHAGKVDIHGIGL